MSRSPLVATPRIMRRLSGMSSANRMVPEETPIALSYSGTTHAVMMATPADLEDFAIGFSFTEGVLSAITDIEAINIAELENGLDIQIQLKDAANSAFQARRRYLAGPVGCGLCGIESIDEAMRPTRRVAPSGLTLSPEEITASVQLLSASQPLHAATGAVHAAGFYTPRHGLVMAREDVGRHNALDKLCGALLQKGVAGAEGAVVVTSRISVEMVQKTASLGAPILIAVSAPTALAIRAAEAADMTLVALTRHQDFDIFTRPDRVAAGAAKNVA